MEEACVCVAGGRVSRPDFLPSFDQMRKRETVLCFMYMQALIHRQYIHWWTKRSDIEMITREASSLTECKCFNRIV